MAQQIITEQGAFTADAAGKINDNFTDVYGSSLLHQSTVTLTDAQIKALPDGVNQEGVTQILAALGVDRVIVPVQIVTRTRFSAGAYGNVAADGQLTFVVGASILSYGNVVDIVRNNGAATDLTGFLSTTENLHLWLPYFGITELVGAPGSYIPNNSGMAPATVANQPLQLYCFNTNGDFTGGNAANTLIVSVAYLVVDVTTGLFS